MTDTNTTPALLPFQSRVNPWLMACFGAMIAGDREERNHRFLEEALELVQATGCHQSEAHQLVDYVYGRDIGEPAQEVGGVMVTLAALCLANGLDMDAAAETELARIWTKVEAIRAKQAAKPKHSPLPMHAATTERTTEYARGLADGVKQSEAAIVAWLRADAGKTRDDLRRLHAGQKLTISGTAQWEALIGHQTGIANAIERREHAQEAGE